MESVKIFSGNGIEAGAIQQLLNDNKIGTWTRSMDNSPILGEGFSGAVVEIYVGADMEEKAKYVLDFKYLND
jgi:hypothetical protein